MKNKTSRRKYIKKTLCFALVLASVVGFGFTAQADEKTGPNITLNSDVKPMASLTEREARNVSVVAERVLKHVENARLAILDNNTDKALRQVDQGLKLVSIIENTVPKLKVTTDIKSGDISYHDEDDVTQRFITVFNESYLEDIVTPVVQAKKAGVGKQLETKEEGQSQGKPSAIQPLEDFSMWRQTTMKLDVVLARSLLKTAEKSQVKTVARTYVRSIRKSTNSPSPLKKRRV